MLSRLWKDEAGFVISSELILLSVLLGIGIIAGFSSLRTAVVFELADLATAVGDLDQSFSFAGVTRSCGTMNGSIFIDQSDFCTPSVTDDDPPVRQPSGCAAVIAVTTGE